MSLMTEYFHKTMIVGFNVKRVLRGKTIKYEFIHMYTYD